MIRVKLASLANNDQGKFGEIRNGSEENSRRVPLKIETFSDLVSLEKVASRYEKKGIFKDGRKLIIRPSRNFYFTSNHFDTFYFYRAAINLINLTRVFHYHRHEVLLITSGAVMLFIAFAHTVSSMYRCKYHFEILTFHSFFFLSLRKASKNQYYCVYFTSELKLFLPALLQVIGRRCDGGEGRNNRIFREGKKRRKGGPIGPNL